MALRKPHIKKKQFRLSGIPKIEGHIGYGGKKAYMAKIPGINSMIPMVIGAVGKLAGIASLKTGETVEIRERYHEDLKCLEYRIYEVDTKNSRYLRRELIGEFDFYRGDAGRSRIFDNREIHIQFYKERGLGTLVMKLLELNQARFGPSSHEIRTSKWSTLNLFLKNRYQPINKT